MLMLYTYNYRTINFMSQTVVYICNQRQLTYIPICTQIKLKKTKIEQNRTETEYKNRNQIYELRIKNKINNA